MFERSALALALAKIGAEYVLRLLPAGTHDWRQFLKPEEIARWKGVVDAGGIKQSD